MNWGNKLLLTFIAFGTGMGYLVYRSVNTNYELVEKDYYKNEIRYQEVIDGTERVNQLSTLVDIQQAAGGIVLQLPAEMKNKVLAGDILFYCAYDEKRDKRFSLEPDAEGRQVFQSSALQQGDYTVKISWINEGKNYFAEKRLTIL